MKLGTMPAEKSMVIITYLLKKLFPGMGLDSI